MRPSNDPPDATKSSRLSCRISLLAGHARETVGLAWPVMVGRSGLLVLITADVIMTGRYRAEELGYYGLGFMAHQVLYVLGMGGLMGVTVLASQADGMGEPQRSGTVWKVGLFIGAILGLLGWLFSFWGEWFFLLTGQGAVLAREGAVVLSALALGLPPMLMYLATALYLEGIRRPQANMWVMVAANVVNFGLNWALIYDHGDEAPWLIRAVDAQGGAGAALATVAARWVMCLGLIVYALLMRDGDRYGIRAALYFPLDVARKLIRLGAPLLVAQGLEASAFLTISLFAGWLGTQQLAVYQIVANLFHIVFMLALGLATATSVRVGNAVGRTDPSQVAWAGWTGIALGVATLGTVGIAIVMASPLLRALYTDNATVVALAAPAVLVTGYFVVVDGAQAILGGALRGAADVVIPSAMIVGGFWCVGVPMAYWFAVASGGGAAGLIAGLSVGAAVASLLLIVRFAMVAVRPIQPTLGR